MPSLSDSEVIASKRRRLLIINGVKRETSEELYEDIGRRLRLRGIDVYLHHQPNRNMTVPKELDAIVSNVELLSPRLMAIRNYSGIAMARPASLRALEEAGLVVMDWALARTRSEIYSLLKKWNVDRLIFKPSFTFGGTAVRVLSKGSIWRARWNSSEDIFCKEVNRLDGDVYKAEMLGGNILITWKSQGQPIDSFYRGGIHRGLRGAYGVRSLWNPGAPLIAKIRTCGEVLAEKGMGHISIDFMRRPDGEFAAIELNTFSIATWWTQRFETFRQQYADAIFEITSEQPIACENNH